MVFKKIIFQNSLMANETPSRPPPLHGKCHLKFPFWFSGYLPNHFNENGFLFRSLPEVAQNCVWYPFYLYKSSIYPKSACLSPSPALGPIAHSQKMKNGAIYVVRWTKSENTDASWIWLAKGQSHYSSQKKYNCCCNSWFQSWKYF